MNKNNKYKFKSLTWTHVIIITILTIIILTLDYLTFFK